MSAEKSAANKPKPDLKKDNPKMERLRNIAYQNASGVASILRNWLRDDKADR